MKTKTKKATPKARITSIAISRLFNLGNYQNIKYDLAVEVPAGVSAKSVMVNLSHILFELKPLRKPEEVDYLQRALAKAEADRDDWEKSNLDKWIEISEEFKRRHARQAEALKALDDLGGTTFFKDAKENWDDEDY